jgi:hypothetical protein
VTWLETLAMFVGGYTAGRMAGRRRTRADLERLYRTVVGDLAPKYGRTIEVEKTP